MLGSLHSTNSGAFTDRIVVKSPAICYPWVEMVNEHFCHTFPVLKAKGMAQELWSCFVSVKESSAFPPNGLFCGLIYLLSQPESAVRNSALGSLAQYIFFYDYELKFLLM